MAVVAEGNYNYNTQALSLLDDNFLTLLAEQKEHEVFARIDALDINQNPIESIEGRVTSGSINIDGNSTVRRTCNITMVTDELDVHDFYWGLKTKFKLEIGLRNKLTGDYEAVDGGDYPDIMWFPQGYYLVAGFTTSISTNSCTVSLSGKDKMCLLNGEMGGQLFASIDFGTEEEKITTMAPIEIITNGSSEDITLKNYFIKPPDADTLPSTILMNDKRYSFVQNQTNGNYCKKQNSYVHITGEVERKVTSNRYYDMYKIVELPDELYEEVDLTEEEYQPDIYYYKRDEENSPYYYIIDATSSKVDNRIYYKLVPVYEESYEITKTKIGIEKIIREAVHAYAKEPYHNIIINDLEEYGLEQLTYKGDTDLYALYSNGEFRHLLRKGQSSDLDDKIKNTDGFEFMSLSGDLTNPTGTLVPLGNTSYLVARFEYGMDIGYRLTELVYPGDLVCNVGDTLTSMLDKIKQMLGEFEYFYDIDGRFIFQKKRTYVQTSWSSLTNNGDEEYVDYSSHATKFSFNFEGNYLISTIQNAPVLTNLRNDFIVWGKRKGVSGAELPIHARYAIDKKPLRYQNLKGEIYATDKYTPTQNEEVIVRDWRELIYQMALDYFAGQGCSELTPVNTSTGVLTDPDHFLFEIGARNPYYYPSGYTGYEQYYTDMQGFWRGLYDPDYVPAPKYEQGKYENRNIPSSEDNQGFYRKIKFWVQPNITDFEVDYYFSSDTPGVEALETRINDQLAAAEPEGSNPDSVYYDQLTKVLEAFNKYKTDSSDSRLYWNRKVFENPEQLDFWIEFLDSDLELSQFSVPSVGDRTKVVNETKANAVVYSDIPNFILYNEKQEDKHHNIIINKMRRLIPANSGYNFIYLPKGMSNLFTISYRSSSVKDKIDELLYQHAYCVDNITITSIPVYHLQPNTRIFVQDQKTNINGEYIVNKISLSLAYNGTMQITASKAPERLY